MVARGKQALLTLQLFVSEVLHSGVPAIAKPGSVLVLIPRSVDRHVSSSRACICSTLCAVLVVGLRWTHQSSRQTLPNLIIGSKHNARKVFGAAVLTCAVLVRNILRPAKTGAAVACRTSAVLPHCEPSPFPPPLTGSRLPHDMNAT